MFWEHLKKVGQYLGLGVFLGFLVYSFRHFTGNKEIIFLFKTTYTLFFIAPFLVDRDSKILEKSIASLLVTFIHFYIPLGFTDTGVAIISTPIFLLILLVGAIVTGSALFDLWASSLSAKQTFATISGLYRFIRHPIYSGYVITAMGWLIFSFSAQNLIIFLAFLLATYLRIQRQEMVLAKHHAYREYQKQVRFCLVPGIY